MNKIDAINLANGKTIKDFKSDISNPPDFAFSHKEFYKDFFTNLTNKKPQLVDGREALKSLQIVHAIYKSNEENREIFLDSDSLISKLGQRIPRNIINLTYGDIMKVPFVDLKKQYLSIKNEVNESIKYNLINTQFIGGKDLVSFKKNLSDLLGLHAVPVANGTDAIYISLKMLGIGRGDEVITTAHSWISTSETISQTGAKTNFC